MNLLYSNLPAFANCCYDGLLAVMRRLTVRLLLAAGLMPTARSRLLLAAGGVPAARSRLLLAAGNGVRGVVVVLVLVRPHCAW